jgi:hypothetical protein
MLRKRDFVVTLDSYSGNFDLRLQSGMNNVVTHSDCYLYHA